MGKASSSKKVARAARGGAKVRPSSRRFTFPLAVALIVLAGVGMVVFARGEFTESTEVRATEAPTTEDHWHAAYGVYVCDAFLPPIPQEPANTDTTGLHTHGDGIMHLHPFSAGAAGKNATLSKWGQVTGMEFGSDSITMPDGTEYSNGYDCNGQPATVKVYVWPADDLEAEPVIYDRDFGDIRFLQNREAITIAVVPEGTEVPRPESVPTLDNLTDVTPSSTLPVDPTATASTVPTSTTLPTVDPAVDPAAETTTTAPASTP